MWLLDDPAYTGTTPNTIAATVVNQGTLVVDTGSTGNGNVTVNGGILASVPGQVTTLSGSISAGTAAHIITAGGDVSGSTLAVAGLATNNNTTLYTKLGDPVNLSTGAYNGNVITVASAGGGFAAGPGTQLQFNPAQPETGNSGANVRDYYRLVGNNNILNNFASISASNFVLPQPPAGYVYAVFAGTTADPNYVDLGVTKSSYVYSGQATWTATSNNHWGNSGPNGAPNWQDTSTGTALPLAYAAADSVQPGVIPGNSSDVVTFGDAGKGQSSVLLPAGNVNVAGLTFNGTSNSYQLMPVNFTGPPSTLNGSQITLNGSSGSTTINVTSGNAPYHVPLAGANTLVKDGPGTLVLGVPSTYTLGTTILNGTLQLGDGSMMNVSIPGDVAVASQGSLAFANATPQSFTGHITGNGSVSMIGNDVLTLAANNSYQGGTTVASGTLRAGSAALPARERSC